jgi:hypothetical protein
LVGSKRCQIWASFWRPSVSAACRLRKSRPLLFLHYRNNAKLKWQFLLLEVAHSEVRYIVNFNNGSTTGPNGVSELGLAPHRATVLTTKHSPVEIAREKSGVGVGCVVYVDVPLCHPLLLPDSRLQSQSRTANFAARKCCLLVTCRPTRKKTGRGAYWLLLNEPIIRVLAPLIAQLVTPGAWCMVHGAAWAWGAHGGRMGLGMGPVQNTTRKPKTGPRHRLIFAALPLNQQTTVALPSKAAPHTPSDLSMYY